MSVARAVISAVGLAAFAWIVHLYGRVLPDAVAALAALTLAVCIASGVRRRARLRRDAFIDAYVDPRSRLSRWLRGRVLISFRAAVVGVLLGLFLAVSLVRLESPAAWVVLAGGAPLAVVTFRGAKRVLVGRISRRYLPIAAWRVTVITVGGLMVCALVALAFHASYPDLGGVGLERAVWHFVDAERARSGGAEVLLQLAAAGEGLRLWVAQQLMPHPGASLAEALGWLAVLAEEAVFVWSYLSYLSPAVLGNGDDDGSGPGGGDSP